MDFENLNTNSDKEVKDILAQCYADSRKAGKVLFNSRFHRDFTSVHDEVFKVIDRRPTHPDYKPRKLIVLPRGMGKTSIANMLVPAKKALFQETNYIVPVSASSTIAQQQSENLKSKLLENKIVEGLFGDMRTKTINKEQWIINVGGEKDGHKVCIMPRGSGQQIRGMLYDDYRPGLIIVDDLEDPEDLLSETGREKQKKWFWGDLMQSVDNYAPIGAWEIIVVGTVVHQDALIVDLMESDNWDKVEFSICDEDLKSNVPEWVDDEWVQDKYNELKEKGMVTTFYREYMNMPSAGGKDSAFQTEYFQYYDPAAMSFKDPAFEHMVIVDTARTAKVSSADSAIVGISVNMETQAWYIRDVVSDKLHYDEVITGAFDMCQRLGAKILGVEVTGLHEFVVYPFKNEMSRRGMSLTLVELQARGGVTEKGKTERVRNLVPYYRQGYVYHNPSCCSKLENQLVSFPHAKLWDIMDAVGYVPEMLEIGQRYMMPIHGEDMEGYAEEVEKEFAELDYERMERPLDNFRVYD